jgi:hypothetical protein
MKARALVGKTIKRVQQSRFESTSGPQWSLDCVEFTDGTFLRFIVLEGEGDYGIEPVYPAREVMS